MPEPIAISTVIKVLLARGDGMTVETLARELDVPLRTVQRWSTTRDPQTGPQWRYTSKLLALADWIKEDRVRAAELIEARARAAEDADALERRDETALPVEGRRESA